MKLYEEILNSDTKLVEALKYAAETEGVLKFVSYERINEYRQLSRLGCIDLEQKGLSGGVVYLTQEGRDYLDQNT
ncbi:hypothetical protein J2W97_001299 [Paenibacillus jamilae]|nr:hypothetical protein [Paenibacillus jamilae]